MGLLKHVDVLGDALRNGVAPQDVSREVDKLTGMEAAAVVVEVV